MNRDANSLCEINPKTYLGFQMEQAIQRHRENIQIGPLSDEDETPPEIAEQAVQRTRSLGKDGHRDVPSVPCRFGDDAHALVRRITAHWNIAQHPERTSEQRDAQQIRAAKPDHVRKDRHHSGNIVNAGVIDQHHEPAAFWNIAAACHVNPLAHKQKNTAPPNSNDALHYMPHRKNGGEDDRRDAQDRIDTLQKNNRRRGNRLDYVGYAAHSLS